MGKRFEYLQGLFAGLASRVSSSTPVGPLLLGSQEGLTRLKSVCTALTTDVSESEQLRLANEVLQLYRGMESSEKTNFLIFLATHFYAPTAQIHEAYRKYQQSETNQTLQQLFSACEPPRQELLRRLNRCDGATFELVRMRAHLLAHLKQNPELTALDKDFSHLLKSWFNRGFLTLQSIDWSTPAVILEKIIQYEAVHEIHDWDELRNRLAPEDRRCYAFFHPAIGFEPLIFVEVALSKGVPGNIKDILASRIPVEPSEADTAVFYSISNCQPGLRGISFGNFLIKQVASELRQEFPDIKQFVTLSPMPGMGQWLRTNSGGELRDSHLPCELHTPSILDNADNDHIAQQKLTQLGAYYLRHVKAADGRPHDPVARFHLANGAILHRVNWPGDISGKGWQQSLGLMVNYLYDLDRIETNHHNYTRNLQVPCSREVTRLGEVIRQHQTNNQNTAGAS